MTIPAYMGVLGHPQWQESPIGDRPWEFVVNKIRYDYTPRGEVGKDLGIWFEPPVEDPAPASQDLGKTITVD